jgi:hypothetical protein
MSSKYSNLELYKSKYLKYKVKYLELKKITGGMLKQENPEKKTEIQVYRISPELGKHYWHAESTRRYNDDIHFTTNDLKYVGMFVRKESLGGHGDNQLFAYFNNNGLEEKIQYSFNTCFIETDPVLDIKEEKSKIKEGKISEAMQRKLERMKIEEVERQMKLRKFIEDRERRKKEEMKGIK